MNVCIKNKNFLAERTEQKSKGGQKAKRWFVIVWFVWRPAV